LVVGGWWLVVGRIQPPNCASRLKILSVFARQILIYLFVVSRARISAADCSGVTQQLIKGGLPLAFAERLARGRYCDNIGEIVENQNRQTQTFRDRPLAHRICIKFLYI